MPLSLLLFDNGVPDLGDDGKLLNSFFLNGPRGDLALFINLPGVGLLPPLLLPSRVSFKTPAFTFKLGVVQFCLVGGPLGPTATQDMPLSFVITLVNVGEQGISLVLAQSRRGGGDDKSDIAAE